MELSTLRDIALKTFAGRYRYGIVAALLLLGFVLRLTAGQDYWADFDQRFPGMWDGAKVTLSQDANEYIGQANPPSWLARPDWASQPFFRPPLASFYFQALYQLVGFDRFWVVAAQSLVTLIGYFFSYHLAALLFGPATGLVSLFLLVVHPVLIFHDQDFEDSALGFALLAAALYFLARHLLQRRNHDLLFAGFLLGLAVLSRNNVLAVAVLSILYLWQQRRKILATPTLPAPTPFGWRVGFLSLAPVLLAGAIVCLHAWQTTASVALPISLFGANARWAIPVGLLFLACNGYLLRQAVKESGAAFPQAGFAAALATVTCPSLFLPSVLLTGVALWAARSRQASASPALPFRACHPLCILLPILLVMAPSSLHAYLTRGSLSPLASTFSMNLQLSNTLFSYYRTALDGPVAVPLLNPLSPWMLFLEENVQKSQQFGDWRMALLHDIQERPQAFFAMLASKGQAHLSWLELPRNTDFHHSRGASALFRLPYVPYAALVGLALLWLAYAPAPLRFAVLVLIPLAGLWLTDIAIFSASRYRSLAIPFLMPAAVAGAVVLFRMFMAREWARLGGGLALMIGTLGAGLFSPPANEWASHAATQFYKDARMELYFENPYREPDTLRVHDPVAFKVNLDRALTLDPDHLPAFYLRTMFQIFSENQTSPTVEMAVDARRSRCEAQDGLCLRICDTLVSISRNRESYVAFVHQYHR
jgi:hypothetical protein